MNKVKRIHTWWPIGIDTNMRKSKKLWRKTIDTQNWSDKMYGREWTTKPFTNMHYTTKFLEPPCCKQFTTIKQVTDVVGSRHLHKKAAHYALRVFAKLFWKFMKNCAASFVLGGRSRAALVYKVKLLKIINLKNFLNFLFFPFYNGAYLNAPTPTIAAPGAIIISDIQ